MNQMASNAPVIDAALLRAYDQDGAVVMRGVVSAEWRERLAAAIERDIAAPGPYYHGYAAEDGRGRFHGNLRTWENDPDFRTFCLDSALPALAAGILRSAKVNLLYDQLFVKEPGTTNRTRWHNDQPYWPTRGWQIMSFWVALDATNAATGALEFVRGSHRWDRWFQPEPFGDNRSTSGYERNPDYEDIPDIEAARDDYEIISWDLDPGDVYVFHALTVHGAGGNVSAQTRRRGYTVRYTGDDATYDGRPGTSAHLRYDGLETGAAMDSERFPVLWQETKSNR